MEMREGKDDIAGNFAVGAIPLAHADPWFGSLVVRLIPSILTLLVKAPSVVAFLQKEQWVIS